MGVRLVAIQRIAHKRPVRVARQRYLRLAPRERSRRINDWRRHIDPYACETCCYDCGIKEVIAERIPTWAEYIALTNPNDAASRFNATIAIGADGVPVVGWNTQTSPSRTYKVFGKVDLSNSVWLEVKDNVELYRFFKVTVEIK